MTKRLVLTLAVLKLSVASAFGQLVIKNDVSDADIIFKVNDVGALLRELIHVRRHPACWLGHDPHALEQTSVVQEAQAPPHAARLRIGEDEAT